MRRLSGFDTQFLAAEAANTYGHYAGLAVYDTTEAELTRERIMALLQERIDGIAPLRWHLKTVPLDLDYPVFVDSQVDVEEHIYETHVTDVTEPEQLGQAVEIVLATPMRRDRPLWEIHLVRDDGGDRAAVIFKLHHAAADGLSAAVIFSRVLDEDPAGQTLAPDVGAGEGRTPGGPEMLLRGLLGAGLHPLRVARAAPAALGHLDQHPALRSMPGMDVISRGARTVGHLLGGNADDAGASLTAPPSRINGPLSAERRVAFGSVPLESVKRVKRALGVSFNDVVIALVGGALRRRLEPEGELPEDPLLAFVPANVRVEGDSEWGNAISSYVVPIPSHESDAAERVGYAHRVMTEAKRRHESVPATLLSDANMLVPPALFRLVAGGAMQLIGSGRVAPPINLIVSNIPGPPRRLHLAGAPCLAHYPFSLILAGVGLNITVVSYEDQIDVGIVGDAELLPDVWELWDDVCAELALLGELADRVAA